MPSQSIRDQLASAIRSGTLRVPKPKPLQRTDFTSKLKSGKTLRQRKPATTAKRKDKSTKQTVSKQGGQKQNPLLFATKDEIPFEKVKITFPSKWHRDNWATKENIQIGKSFFSLQRLQYDNFKDEPFLIYTKNTLLNCVENSNLYFGKFIAWNNKDFFNYQCIAISGEKIGAKEKIEKVNATPIDENINREHVDIKEKPKFLGIEERASKRVKRALALACLGREPSSMSKSVESDDREVHLVYTPQGGISEWRLGKGHI